MDRKSRGFPNSRCTVGNFNVLFAADKDEIERDSRSLLLEYWVQLSALLSGEFKALMPTWDHFVSVYGKVRQLHSYLKSCASAHLMLRVWRVVANFLPATQQAGL